MFGEQGLLSRGPPLCQQALGRFDVEADLLSDVGRHRIGRFTHTLHGREGGRAGGSQPLQSAQALDHHHLDVGQGRVESMILATGDVGLVDRKTVRNSRESYRGVNAPIAL